MYMSVSDSGMAQLPAAAVLSLNKDSGIEMVLCYFATEKEEMGNKTFSCR